MMTKQLRYKRPPLYRKQLEAIFHESRYGLIEASTKAGKTVGCIAWLFEQAAIKGGEGRNFWWVAPIFPQAKIAFRRMKRFVPQGLYESNETELTIKLLNGSVIWFKGADKPDSLYGEDVYAAIMDEASRCKEEAWYALRSTLTATNAPIRLIGNVKGRKNFFFNLCRRAESGDKDMQYHIITAYDAVEGGVLKLEEIEDAKRVLPENVFKELYLCQPSDDGGNPFGLQHIAKCVRELSQEQPHVWGVDLAKSVDYTVAIALDKKGNVCRFARWQAPWEITKKRILDHVGTTPTLIDSTGVGDPIVEELQKNRPNIEGFKFTSTTKQQLMEGLALAIQQQEIGYPDGMIRTELETYEYEYTRTGVRYTAPEGLHDDCVCSLALANRKRTIPSVGSNVIEYYNLYINPNLKGI
jgi:hypothetical protein